MPPGSTPGPAALTHGTLLGGRVPYAQPADGFRTGIEPVLLAAAVPAAPGDRVIEAGTGAGAALLCLTARVPGLVAHGVERDPAMAAIARHNADAAFTVTVADVLKLPDQAPFDHALANPPWHDAQGTLSPVPGREAAKRTRAGLLPDWTAALARLLRHHGTLTLALPAGSVADAMAALAGAGLGSPALLPLWPRAGREAKLVLLRAVRGGRGPCRILPGLVLHAPDGGYTAEADAILRGGGALPL